MKGKRFTEEQIIAVLKEAEAGSPVTRRAPFPGLVEVVP